MAVSTHITNSTVPDCRMRVPRRRNTSTAQSWRFVPDANGTPVPIQREGRGWFDRTHEHMALEHATDTNEPKTDTRSYKHGFGDPVRKVAERAMV